MTNDATETRSVIVEREIAFPPDKIWRALTQPHLIEEWLMKNDFMPIADHRFTLRGDWGAVDCQVRTIEPNSTLSYTWDAMEFESVVTLDSHADKHGHSPSHGAVGLPSGSGTSVRRREIRMAEIPGEPGAGFGANGLTKPNVAPSV